MNIKLDFYAVVSQRFTASGYAAGKPSVRVTRTKPNCDATEVPIRISLQLPESLFKRPSLRATIVVPEGQAQFEITPDVEEGIAQLVREHMGITMQVHAGEAA
ncbi:hypothetical protein SAMN05216321_101146 [Cupriavidus sp. OV038]|jgi:hypothetical protein|uniref:hypothetical protein n=1 Tax=unclassified Cupriavidus TaxID=2640874 RepID=UPI0008E31803|nr:MULTISPECIES: hypothetical protein [unclassified Cupriavidus]SFB68982.1 hypothetical protein SAMN05216321_101146 [Cupriavidus sp. OV038]SFO58385.1 hypothetical protein SAMN05216322_101146 [Cupriavidus sp. OV096]